MLIVYRKSDGAVSSNSGTNSVLPEGPSFEAEVQNAIGKFGGVADDYGEYRLHDEDDEATVQNILNAGSYELTFDAQGNPTGVVTHPRLTAIAGPNPAAANETVTVTATLPLGSPDNTVTFQLQGGAEYDEAVAGAEASHAYAFVLTGIYYVEVSSAHHGRVTVEVVVQ